MLGLLLDWLRPRWSVLRFWVTEPRHNSAVRRDETDHGLRAGRDGAILAPSSEVVDLGMDSDPDAIVEIARAASLTATEAASRLARGSRCASLLDDGEFATTCWVSADAEWVGELAGWFAPAPGDAYVWDCATRTVFRGRHFYPRLLCEVVERLAAQGFRRVWIATEIINWRSARGVNRAGFQPVGLVVAGRFFGLRWQRVIADPAVPPELVEALCIGLGQHQVHDI